MRRLIAGLLIAVTVIFLAVFVLTPWVYSNHGPGNILVRTARLSGRSEVFSTSGWMPATKHTVDSLTLRAVQQRDSLNASAADPFSDLAIPAGARRNAAAAAP